MNNGLQITNLSPTQKPCILLQWPNITILLDCPLDLSPLFAFVPHVYQSPRLKNAAQTRRFNLPYLKEINNLVYVEGVPEVHHVSTDAIEMDNVDAILVSNYDSLLALPFYTEGTGFNGQIFITDIALHFGKLLMQEMIEYFARIDFSPIDNQWREENICLKFPKQPVSNPKEWKKFYTSKEMNDCLARVTTLSYNQSTEVFRVNITPVSSGYTLGSANWTIKTENEKVAYMSSFNDARTHAKPLDVQSLRGCDYMLLTSLTKQTEFTPYTAGNAIMFYVSDTLKKGGNVLIPISPVGQIFDLIDAVSNVISDTNGISVDTPIYFISPIAKSTLAMASISAEWMCEDRQNAVYKPEEPYRHLNLIKNGRLRIFDSLYGDFSKEYKTPCVMFTGHTSLRLGDAAHMVEVWGNDPKNAVLLTDPDFSYEDIREPFRNLPIRFIFTPLDFRIDFKQLSVMLSDLRPKYLITLPQHLRPLVPNRPDCMVLYGQGSVTSLGYDEPILLSSLSKIKQKLVRVKVHAELVKSLKFKQHPKETKIAIAPVSCHLSCYDHDFQLVPATTSNPVARKHLGRLYIKKLLAAFKENKIEAIDVSVEPKSIIKLPVLNATITVFADGKKSKLTAQTHENRQQILKIMKSTLVEDDGIVYRK